MNLRFEMQTVTIGDGLRDAGVLIEDDMRHMPTLTLTAGPKTPLGCVVLTIHPMTTPTEGDPR